NLMIVAISVGMGLGVTAVPELFAVLPERISVLTDSGIVMGSLTAIILNIVFNMRKHLLSKLPANNTCQDRISGRLPQRRLLFVLCRFWAYTVAHRQLNRRGYHEKNHNGHSIFDCRNFPLPQTREICRYYSR